MSVLLDVVNRQMFRRGASRAVFERRKITDGYMEDPENRLVV